MYIYTHIIYIYIHILIGSITISGWEGGDHQAQAVRHA